MTMAEPPTATTSTEEALVENGHGVSGKRNQPDITIKIVSATYGPCEGVRLQTGELSNDETASIPICRDVAHFLRALLLASRMREEEHRMEEQEDIDDNDEEDSSAFPHIVRVHPTVGGVTKSFIYLLGRGKSMNAVFGDPCPGTSKRLSVHYVVTEAMNDDNAKSRAAKTEVHHVSFSEHERVVLRRRLTFFQDDSQLKEALVRATNKQANQKNTSTMELEATDNVQPTESDQTEDEETLTRARRMGRSRSITEFTAATSMGRIPSTLRLIPEAPDSTITAQYSQSTSCTQNLWRLRSAVSEIVLPIVLPFLEFRERVQCRLICRSWKHVVRDWGVATNIDSNDRTTETFSRPFLRGILSNSYSSLHSLFLSGFESLTQDDLHPAIPHLRKLRSLDVARCHNLDDSTMILLSQHVHQSLEVLYIKGLRNVSDVGLKAICHSCRKIEVLDISYVPLTDEGGMAIQQLQRLRALFTRDNYHLTNRSIDAITASCTRLAQLTLWGCTRMKHLRFDAADKSAFSSGKLVFLNLWGCYNLKDEAAESLGNMKNLSSLVVSECHRLTDRFVVTLTSRVPQLNHLHLRYCKRITDSGINAITNNMNNLYSLDLSFCTRVTAASIFNLLEIRHYCLSELRLKTCTKLEIAYDPDGPPLLRGAGTGGGAGRLILNALRSNADHSLCVLDVRECGGQPNISNPYPESDPFVTGMKVLQFEQRVPGFFCRPARWSSVHRQLVDQTNI
jgi:hypothetical protein